MEQCENNSKMLIISILFICKENQNFKKNLTALEFWRNVYVCGLP